MSDVEIKIFIYGLVDPRTRTVRYVGGSYDPERRFRDHRYDTKGKPNRKKRWFLELLRLQLLPDVVLLEEVLPGENWRVREEVWKTYFVRSNLVNGKPGRARAAWREALPASRR